ncbi:MAG: heme exporter protein CcmD [Proteobacteria bacterium]|nr:MAG: heme exporter protein CcmD [Pseudomonadota bacterium]
MTSSNGETVGRQSCFIRAGFYRELFLSRTVFIRRRSLQFANLSEFIHMGGHGLYVWFCYALAFVVVVYNIWSPFYKRSAIGKKIARQSRRERAGAQ